MQVASILSLEDLFVVAVNLPNVEKLKIYDLFLNKHE